MTCWNCAEEWLNSWKVAAVLPKVGNGDQTNQMIAADVALDDVGSNPSGPLMVDLIVDDDGWNWTADVAVGCSKEGGLRSCCVHDPF